ncbi:MAG TPA: hypothetical protein VGC14_24265 [Rhizobium sp.]
MSVKMTDRFTAIMGIGASTIEITGLDDRIGIVVETGRAAGRIITVRVRGELSTVDQAAIDRAVRTEADKIAAAGTTIDQNASFPTRGKTKATLGIS